MESSSEVRNKMRFRACPASSIHRQAEANGGTMSGLAFSINTSVVRLYQMPGNRQPQTCANRIPGFVEPIENVWQYIRGNTHSGIFHANFSISSFHQLDDRIPHFDGSSARGIPEGIGYQVG